jgi:hypothetical protein
MYDKESTAHTHMTAEETPLVQQNHVIFTHLYTKVIFILLGLGETSHHILGYDAMAFQCVLMDCGRQWDVEVHSHTVSPR